MEDERFREFAEYFIKLVRFGVGGAEHAPKKPENVAWADVYQAAKGHSLSAIVYHALKKANVKPDEEVWKRLEKKYRLAVQADTEQMYAWEELQELASVHDFKVMPMKGVNMKNIYPYSWLREMGDIDVLYEKKDFKKVKKALESVGYAYDVSTAGSNHQIFKRPPLMNVEMHRDIFSDENPFYEFYLAPFDFAKPTEKKNVYAFSLEDEYVYIILHAGKHYFACGSGVRTFLDVHIFLDRYQSQLDFDYIQRQLEKADEIAKAHGSENSIVEFEKTARYLADNWFKSDEICLDETAIFVLSGGVYGVLERSWEKAYKKEGKKYFWRRLFPSYKKMCKRNPILKKLPFLLPFFWFGRLFKGLTSKKARQELRYIKEQEKKKKNTQKA